MSWRLKCDSGYVCELGEDTKCEIDLPSSCHVRILHGGWSHTVELAKKCQNWGVHGCLQGNGRLLSWQYSMIKLFK